MGISKYAGEFWCNYFNKYGVDVRSHRYRFDYKSAPRQQAPPIMQ
jgi:hypothetical protein